MLSGKPFSWAKAADVNLAIGTIRYYAGWADKIQGKEIPVSTRHDMMNDIILTPRCSLARRSLRTLAMNPWESSAKLSHGTSLVSPTLKGHPEYMIAKLNAVLMLAWKIGPALATGNTIVMKCSELTPLTALFMCNLSVQAGIPPGVFNLLVGYGHTVGAAIASHMDIQKVAFTGSTLVGRKISEAAAKSNLKNVTLELGGKSPNIIFDDCEMEQAINWTTFGILCVHLMQIYVALILIYMTAGTRDRLAAPVRGFLFTPTFTTNFCRSSRRRLRT